MGVLTQEKSLSWKKRWMAKASLLRMRNTAPNRLVRGRKWAMERRNSGVCPFFCKG